MKRIPTARILQAIRGKDWTVSAALAELLDNAFGELRGRASTVWIYWDPKPRNLVVLDNGQGMKDVADLFTLGKGEMSGRGDTGLYGVGGSEALVWLSNQTRVTTLITTLTGARVASGQTDWGVCIESEEYPDIDSRWRWAGPANCPMDLFEQEHGTRIDLTIRAGLQINPEVIQDQLSRLFGVGLRTGRQIIWITKGKGGLMQRDLQAWNPGEIRDSITTVVTIAEGLSADVYAGWVDGLSIANSKLSVNYVYRRIKDTTAGFGRAVQGAVGYVDLSPGWLPHLTTTKDNIREDSRHLEEALMEAIVTALEPLISRLQQAKRAKIFTNVRISLQHRFQSGFMALAKRAGGERGGQGGGGEGEKPPRPPRRPPQEPLVAEIEIRNASDVAMDGLLCKVDVDAQKAVAHVNEEHFLVIMALDAEPVNQRLLEQILIQALAKEIVERDALNEFGLLSKADAAAVVEKYRGDTVLYVTRLLTDGVLSS